MKLKQTHGTETFINRNGMYAIKQQPDPFDDPMLIELSPGQMRAIIADMKLYLKDKSWQGVEDESEV